MPFEIIKIQDRMKLTAKEVEDIIVAHIQEHFGRNPTAVEFHMGRNEFGAATVYLKDE